MYKVTIPGHDYLQAERNTDVGMYLQNFFRVD